MHGTDSILKFEGISNIMSTGKQFLIDILSLPAHDFVKNCFIILIGKSPSSEDIIEKVNYLCLGGDRISMLVEFYNSAESFNYRHNLSQSAGSDDEFIELLYKRYLRRSADEGGLEYHVAQLKGKDRRSVEDEFSRSSEARATVALYNEIDALVAADHADRPWWRWHSRQRRRQNLQHEITLHIAMRARQIHEQAVLALIKEEICLGIDQLRISMQHQDVENNDSNQVLASNDMEEVKVGEMARRTLRRLRKLTANSAREYA